MTQGHFSGPLDFIALINVITFQMFSTVLKIIYSDSPLKFGHITESLASPVIVVNETIKHFNCQLAELDELRARECGRKLVAHITAINLIGLVLFCAEIFTSLPHLYQSNYRCNVEQFTGVVWHGVYFNLHK